MKCPGCGAAVSKKMAADGECGYCHTLLPGAAPVGKPAPAPQVVQFNVQVRPPDIQVGGLFDSVTARIAGCFSGCLSAAISLGITAMILLFVGWQLWIESRSVPSPAPAPAPPPPIERSRKRR